LGKDIKKSKRLKMKYKISKKGQNLWKQAKKIIPGGTMLFSKRPELFLPNIWPTYFSKAKGCLVWDLDGQKYTDMTTMSVGTNSLGYCNSKIDNAVKKAINKGNMSSLNCPEEVHLSKKLLEINTHFKKIRFTRSGGEANSIAIRIARAASGKDNIAFNGYHGWHDWYLASNLSSKNNLNKHLLNNLQIKGVPKKLKDTVFPFEMNSFEKLKKLCLKKNIGVIKMEVFRSTEPDIKFLKKLRIFTKKNNIILIFDECTSGFRQTLGGIHKIFKVNPDILILGKALGNGYPINAILGTSKVMNYAQDSFISSTFWTERLGPVAALATLKEMKRIKSWKIISENGRFIKKKWQQIADKYNIKIDISGLDAIPSFTFKKNHLKYKTFLTYSFLQHNYLAGNTIYLSTAHTKKIIVEYLNHLDTIFELIKKFENKVEDLKKYYKGKISENFFRRIN